MSVGEEVGDRGDRRSESRRQSASRYDPVVVSRPSDPLYPSGIRRGVPAAVVPSAFREGKIFRGERNSSVGRRGILCGTGLLRACIEYSIDSPVTAIVLQRFPFSVAEGEK